MLATDNPFEGKPVQIQLKSAIIFEGRECSELPSYMYRSDGAVIEKWLPTGIIINGGYYIPASNIKCISPYKTASEIKEMRQASGSD
ncbi:MAG: hypothetical protein ACYDHX_07965 [Methanothrix sp.]